MMELQTAINNARKQWHFDHGKCSMCDVNDIPRDGFHRGRYPCGNEQSCAICHNCLPIGEQCMACGRVAQE